MISAIKWFSFCHCYCCFNLLSMWQVTKNKMILLFKLDILMITYSKAIEATCESADLIQAVIFLPLPSLFCNLLSTWQVTKAYTKIKMIPFLELHFNGYNKALVTWGYVKIALKWQTIFFAKLWKCNFMAVSPLVSFWFCSWWVPRTSLQIDHFLNYVIKREMLICDGFCFNPSRYVDNI